MALKSDDYTNKENDADNIYHGSSAEIGSIQKSITPNGEIMGEEELTRSKKSDAEMENPFDDLLVPGTAADVTEEDLMALGDPDLSMDLGDDESLQHRIFPVDFAGEELDIPGSELDDDQEELGSEDEENNGYSLSDN